jgi:uncharacterized RDD family membrane protein YckC
VTDSPAGFWRSLAALVYDLILLLGILFAATFLLLLFRSGSPLEPKSLPYTFYLMGVSVFFFSWFWTHGGQTLGMRAWRIQLVATDGSPIQWGQCIIRCVIAFVSMGLFGIGYLWMLFDPKRRSWQDLVSKTHVIRIKN